jgi:hypothetical protein
MRQVDPALAVRATANDLCPSAFNRIDPLGITVVRTGNPASLVGPIKEANL